MHQDEDVRVYYGPGPHRDTFNLIEKKVFSKPKARSTDRLYRQKGIQTGTFSEGRQGGY